MRLERALDSSCAVDTAVLDDRRADLNAELWGRSGIAGYDCTRIWDLWSAPVELADEVCAEAAVDSRSVGIRTESCARIRAGRLGRSTRSERYRVIRLQRGQPKPRPEREGLGRVCENFDFHASKKTFRRRKQGILVRVHWIGRTSHLLCYEASFRWRGFRGSAGEIAGSAVAAGSSVQMAVRLNWWRQKSSDASTRERTNRLQ
jgi:hypothetical protein